MRDELRDLLARTWGTAAAARILRLDEQASPAEPEGWGLDAMRGRVVELSARGSSATLTTAIELVIEAQVAAEPVAWVTLANATFYPPDVAESGVDLSALVVVRVRDAITAARAAEQLLRSGAFGLVVLDFGGVGEVEVAMAHLGRLVTLAQAHDAAVVCVTKKASDTPSLGSLVSLRAEALRLCNRSHGYDVRVRVLKDKRRGPGWSRTIKRRGPAGF
ncbi:MAG: recombinase A [Myxococcales bacterium]|nr:recombinase A [Myxococcales bacterium]